MDHLQPFPFNLLLKLPIFLHLQPHLFLLPLPLIQNLLLKITLVLLGVEFFPYEVVNVEF